MTITLQMELILLVILFLTLTLLFVSKNKILLKYSLVWLISGVIMLIAVLIPGFIDKISLYLGFEVSSNMVLFGGICILILIAFNITIVISNQSKKIKLLIQEVSALKSQVNKK